MRDKLFHTSDSVSSCFVAVFNHEKLTDHLSRQKTIEIVGCDELLVSLLHFRASTRDYAFHSFFFINVHNES